MSDRLYGMIKATMDQQHSMEMDVITAHLDRGWELLAKGELEAAKLSAAHILKVDPDSPEGFTLLGAITLADGDPQEAMEHLRHAIDLEPDYLDGILYTAEVALHAVQDHEYTLQLCEDAEEVAREPEDLLDLCLLRMEARIARHEMRDARTAATQLADPPYPAPGYYLRIGRAWLELEQPVRAIELLQVAAEDPSLAADAHYFLAVALEKDHQPRLAMQHFMSVHELDSASLAGDGSDGVKGARQIVDQTLAALPSRLAQLMSDVPVEILEYPSREIIAEGFDPRGVVFLSGVPRSEQTRASDPGGHLSCVFIYRSNVERLSPSEADWPQEITDALEREAGLFFGYSPEDST